MSVSPIFCLESGHVRTISRSPKARNFAPPGAHAVVRVRGWGSPGRGPSEPNLLDSVCHTFDIFYLEIPSYYTPHEFTTNHYWQLPVLAPKYRSQVCAHVTRV